MFFLSNCASLFSKDPKNHDCQHLESFSHNQSSWFSENMVYLPLLFKHSRFATSMIIEKREVPLEKQSFLATPIKMLDFPVKNIRRTCILQKRIPKPSLCKEMRLILADVLTHVFLPMNVCLLELWEHEQFNVRRCPGFLGFCQLFFFEYYLSIYFYIFL